MERTQSSESRVSPWLSWMVSVDGPKQTHSCQESSQSFVYTGLRKEVRIFGKIRCSGKSDRGYEVTDRANKVFLHQK